MAEPLARDSEHIITAARALLEQHGFEVVRTDAMLRAPEPAQEIDPRGVQWINLFRATLMASLHTGNASLGELARRLAMSPRTLQRRLAAHHTTLRAEINTTRRDLAARLSQNGANQSLIALRLGYSDTRALRRASRRWRTERG